VKAPIGEPGTQHWIGGAVVVVVDGAVVVVDGVVVVVDGAVVVVGAPVVVVGGAVVVVVLATSSLNTSSENASSLLSTGAVGPVVMQSLGVFSSSFAMHPLTGSANLLFAFDRQVGSTAVPAFAALP